LVNEIKIYTDTDQTFYLKKTWAFVVWTQNLGLDSNPNHNPKTKKNKTPNPNPNPKTKINQVSNPNPKTQKFKKKILYLY
jgi:hypothetical protein